MLKLSKNTLGMLIAKYRSVLLHMLRKGAIALAVIGLPLAAPAPALAADYAVGTGQTYVSLEALRTAGVTYADGDTVTVYQNDLTLTAPLSFGGAAVTLQGGGPGTITLQPAADGIRLFTASSGSITLEPGLVVEGFVNTGGGNGGAGSFNNSSITVNGSQFTGNTAQYGLGGALYLENSRLTADNALFSGNQAGTNSGTVYNGGAIYAKDSTLTLNNTSFIGNTGGAITADANAADTTINLYTASGKTTLFTGNIQPVPATATSIVFRGDNDHTAYLNVDGAGLLDMRDPLNSYGSALDNYNIAIYKDDVGTWKLGGSNQLKANGSAGTSFFVNAGALDLYKDASITISKGVFTLNNGATLISRGGNTISGSTVMLHPGSTLGFDLTNAAPGGTANLTIFSPALIPWPQINIDIMALNGSGTFNLVASLFPPQLPLPPTLRGEAFNNTRATGSLTIAGTLLQLTSNAQNGVVRWNGGNGSWNATGTNWTGQNTSGVPGGTDLTGQTKFLHGDAVIFDDAAGGNVTIQNTGVQVAARPDGSSGTNPGLTIQSGNWSFTGGALEGGNIRFSGSGGIAFDSRSLTQRITLDQYTTANIGALPGHTLSFTGFDTTQLGPAGGVICADYDTDIRLNGSGSLIFANNKTLYGGAAINSDGAVSLESGSNTFSGNTAYSDGGAISGDTVTIKSGANIFTGNTANGQGGAVYSWDASLTAAGGDIIFTGNTAGSQGGAVYAGGNATLTALSGDILFRGNTHRLSGATAIPNAMYLGNYGNDNTLTLAARSGRSILFYDPIASDAANPNLTIMINPGAADTGTILFDKHQSDIYGNTTVRGGTLKLTGGAVYGANTNTGSFTLNSGARLSADAAGGTINAGTVSLKDGSVTAVDVSSGNSLALNGSVTMESGAGIDITGYSTGEVNVVTSNNTITGNFTRLLIGGTEQNLSATSSLDSFINSGAYSLAKTNSDKTITLKQTAGGGLVWNNTAPGSAHGTFKIASSYTLNTALADNTSAAAYGFGWNGKTLTKTGSGTLTLAAANTYSGGTLLNEGTLSIANNNAMGSGSLTMVNGTTLSFADSHSLANAVSLTGNVTLAGGDNVSASLTGGISGSGGITKTGSGSLTLTGNNSYTGDTVVNGGTLTMTGVNSYAGGTIINSGSTLTVNSLAALGSGNITNNARLNFTRVAPAAGQTIDFANRYTGSGTIGIQASLTAAAQWSDLLKFDSAPAGAGVYFTFTDGSSLSHMKQEGLHFAELATVDGNNATFSLAGTSLAGASQLSIGTSDNRNYYLTSGFNPSLGKVYSETAAAGLGQAAGLHGTETFGAIGKAAAGATGGDTGVYAGGGRSDARHYTGSHADIQGNSFALALAWEKGKTTWGLIGQKFDGSYTTTHTANVGGAGQTIHSAGDLAQHDLGLFAEYRPDDSGRYYRGLIKAGNSKSEFRADNAQGGSRYSSDRGVFALSAGGGFVKETSPNRSLETYQHLIYTRVGSDRVTDSIGQDIRFDASDSVRLLSGARWTLEREGKPSFYAGAALDYEFRGKTNATIDGSRADGADLKGLTGILELGFSAKQSETLSLDGALYGYVGKKEGLAGSLTLTKRF